jgi:hypothetical protein
MRYVIAAGVALLAVLAGHAAGQPEKKGEPVPPWARVTLGGEVRDLLELRSKTNVLVLLDRDLPRAAADAQWQGPPPQRPGEPEKGKTGTVHLRSMQVGDAAWVVVRLDETEKDLPALLPKLRPSAKGSTRVVMEGTLAAAKDKDPFVTYATGWGTMRPAEGAPGVGVIRVEGKGLAGKYEWGKGKTAALAVENGWSPIVVVGKAAEGVVPKGAGGLLVTGKLLVQKQGPLVVEADRVEVLEK